MKTRSMLITFAILALAVAAWLATPKAKALAQSGNASAEAKCVE